MKNATSTNILRLSGKNTRFMPTDQRAMQTPDPDPHVTQTPDADPRTVETSDPHVTQTPVVNPRIVFMGTPEFAVASLDAIVQAGYPVVGVITAPDKPAGRGMQ